VVAADDYWTSYRKTAMKADELLLQIRIPLRSERRLRFLKIGTRRAQAISKVSVALAWSSDGAEPWREVRLALGSVAATTVRAKLTEAAIEGHRPDRATADRAAAVLAGELDPIDDVRSTANYRRLAATRAVHRFIRDEGNW
jgi:xanthine dehydrogenase small subunit